MAAVMVLYHWGHLAVRGGSGDAVYAAIEECLLSYETLQGGLENVFVF